MIRPAAFVFGILVVVVALGNLTVRSTGRNLGAELRVATVPTGEAHVSRLDPFLVARNMRPGGAAARGAVTVTNTSGRTLAFRIRARPSARDLDRLVWLAVSARGDTLYRGTLAELRPWARRSLTLESGAREQISLRVWLPSSVTGGYRSRVEDVNLELKAEGPAT